MAHRGQGVLDVLLEAAPGELVGVHRQRQL